MKTLFTLLSISVLFQVNVPAQCWQQVFVRGAHTVALSTDSTLWTWGLNYYGQLGDGTHDDQNTPKQIGTDHDWVQVAAQFSNTIAIKNDGTLWTCGYNYWYQLGNGTNIDHPLLQPIGAGYYWQQIAGGYLYGAAIQSDSTLWTWGSNYSGQLGNGSNINNNIVPQQVGTDHDWRMVSAAEFHTAALKNNGTLWIWGSNTYGQLGNGNSPSDDEYTPVPMDSATDWQTVSVGRECTVALKNDGSLWTWGKNVYGQLGLGNNTQQSTPVQVGSEHWQHIAAGGYHTLAIKSDGSLWSWGKNDYGQLGDGTLDNRNFPQQIGTAHNWAWVEAGDRHSVALTNDGVLWAWGYNYFGQLGDGTTTDKTTPVKVSCAASGTQGNNLSVEQLKIFPNPVQDQLFMQISDWNTEELFFEVRNLLGESIISIQHFQPAAGINVKGLAPGIYTVIISHPTGQIAKKFVKM